MKTLLTAIYNLIATLSPGVRLGIGIASIALAVNSYVNALWADLFAKVDAIAAGSMGAANFSGLGLLNYIFPVDTLLSFVTGYATLRIACASVRIVKSFIPTIS